MNLAEIKPHEICVEIKNPADGSPTGLKIYTNSIYSGEPLRKMQMLANKRERRREEDGVQISPQQEENDDINILSLAVTRFEWGEHDDWDGIKIQADETGKKKVLSREWIRRQLTRAMADETAFFTNYGRKSLSTSG